MKLQLALNVTDLDASVDYYQRLFGVVVSKRKSGYANFDIAKPALKLVLFERETVEDRLNHLGVEVFSDDEVNAAAQSQQAAGLDVVLQPQDQCCYAKQNKAISYAPDGTMWEWYVKLDDLESFDSPTPATAPTMCC